MLKSAIFSAIGVAVSPGINVINADVAVVAAVNSNTVSFLSSKDAIVFLWCSGAEAYFDTDAKDTTPIIISNTDSFKDVKVLAKGEVEEKAEMLRVEK